MELEEAVKTLQIIANKSDQPFKFAIETVLDYINILERATDNKYCYVKGGRTLYSRLKELEKEYLIKAYLRLRNEVNKYIKENLIPKKKIKDKIKELKEEHKKQLTIETMPSHTFSLRQEEDGIFGDVLKVLQELLEE